MEEDGYACNSCCYLFSVNMTLTEAGLAAGPGFGLAAVHLLFAFMRLLADTGAYATLVVHCEHEMHGRHPK